MNFPEDFLGGVPELQAYRRKMNFLPAALAERCESYHANSPGKGQLSMAALAGLGELSVCDYFAPLGAQMLVIEDTQLVWWMLDRLEGKSIVEMSTEFAAECLRKMSGSAEILSALYAKFTASDQKEKPRQAECEFWVVVLDIDSHKINARAYNTLVGRARQVMRNAMSRPYVLAEIVGKEKFGKELESRISGN